MSLKSSRPGRAVMVMVLWLLCWGRGEARDELSSNHAMWPRDVFDWSYVLIATPDEWRALDTLEDASRERFLGIFWKRRDPTPTTLRNEFLEQFEERVDFSMTRFSVRSQPEPWDRRGEIYIRFGEPDERIDSSFDAYYEKWYYFSENLKFMFAGGAEGQRIVPFREFSGRVQSLPRYYDDRRRMESRGVVYVPPLGEVPIDLSFDLYPFRRADGLYDVYVACAVPMKAVAKRNRQRQGTLDYTARVVAFDSSLVLQWSDSAQVQDTLATVPSDAVAQNQFKAVLAPGLYVMAAELEDGNSRKRGVSSFDRWLVPYEQSVGLDLSPLVVAAAVRDATEGSGSFVRNGKEIVPMAGHVFKNHQDIAFYHEVYNLKPDSSGTCRYRVEYALYNADKSERRQLVSQELSSAQPQTYQAGTIPHGEIEKGAYILEAATTDLVGGVTKIALARLKVD
jgi:GWxTD domain-containing protein